jgi:CHAD domain-containing protein
MASLDEPRPLPRSVEELLAQILSAQAQTLRACVPGAVAGEDPEHVHDLRVATRRARAALQQFADLVDDAPRRSLRDELRWLAGVAGRVRDLDVFGPRLDDLLTRVDAPPGARRRLQQRLRRRQGPARQALQHALRAPRCGLLLDALDACARGLRHTPPTALAAAAAVPRVRRGLRSVQRVRLHKIPRLPDAELHALRIQVKRARYTCEFFAGVSPVDLTAVRTGLVTLQDVLGAHQDAAVGEAWLRDWLSGLWRSRVQGAERDALSLAAGALIQAERDRRAELRRSVVDVAPRCLEVVAGARAALKVHLPRADAEEPADDARSP